MDCNDVRGNRDVVQQMFDTVTWSNSDTAQLLTGHRGCGKSTELLRLKARLEEAGYAVIYFEADEDLDVNDILYSDLLLAIARRMEDELRKSRQLAQSLGDRLQIAYARWNLALVEEAEGNLDIALEFIREAEAIFSALGSPTVAQAHRDHERLEGKLQ
ncbi:MAG: AAA family ATPase [Chloroflexota bacterium]|nr:AAA family ATPase [Chloroflexota bacterium]